MQETVPPAETWGRVGHLQGLLSAKGIPLALIRQPADLFYYTGTVADGFLAVPAAGEPRFLVRRPQDRLAAAAIPWELVFYSDIRELPALLDGMPMPPAGPLGLELDVLPAALYLRLENQIFPERSFKDVSPLIRQQRMVKSAYEIGQIRRAAAILDEAVAAVPEILRPGLTELELSAAMEYRLRLLGHQGLIRVRNANLEIFFGHVLSGHTGLEAAYTDTPSGGLGFSPAFPQGPSLKPLAPGEPITVDLASCVNGYVADMTRLFVLGDLPAAAWRVYDLILELFAYFEAEGPPRSYARRAFPGGVVNGGQGRLRGFFHGPGPRAGELSRPRGGPGAGRVSLSHGPLSLSPGGRHGGGLRAQIFCSGRGPGGPRGYRPHHAPGGGVAQPQPPPGNEVIAAVAGTWFRSGGPSPTLP